MIVDSIRVENFRSVRKETLPLEDLTALVGANGVGKSTFLRALELFYNPSPKVVDDDFYAGDCTKELIVAITYKNLGPPASALFAKYVQGDSLTVERVFVSGGGRVSARYFGATLQHLGFAPVRAGLEVKDRGKTARAAYDSLSSQAPYTSLAPWTALAAVTAALSAWETANPNACSRVRDDGQFFGFTSVATGYLGRFTRLLYIPAVRDAVTDAEEGRGSVLTALMDLAVRNAVASKASLLRLKSRSQALFERALNPSTIPELASLGAELSETLGSFVADASIELRWRPLTQLEFPLPSADVRVVEDGYPSGVERTGHGLQRAFILTVLQHLAMAQVGVNRGPDTAGALDRPNLLLAIEEPELYQHPNRQRHFASTLTALADGSAKGVADRTQILYGTHSPLFVSVDGIHRVRLLRRVGEQAGYPKVTRVMRTGLSEIARSLWAADGCPTPEYTSTTLLPRLKAIMTPLMSEGFFADSVVLVEGEDDRAALLGVAAMLGHRLERKGMSIIPCGGKTCLDRPFVVFTQLEIPVYLVWDGDKGTDRATPTDNHRLLRLLSEPATDWPQGVTSRYACFERDLETTMEAELGTAVYERLLADCQAHYGIPKKKHARKNPSVVARILEKAQHEGCRSSTLEAIVAQLHAFC